MDVHLYDYAPLKLTSLDGYGTSINISRPGSAQSVRSRNERTERPSLQATTPEASPGSGRPVSFIVPVHEGTKWYKQSFLDKVALFAIQCISIPISGLFLVVVVAWAILADVSGRLPKQLRPVKPATFPWDDREKWKSEKCVKDVRYYAQQVGFDIINEEVETDDGFLLR